MISLHGQGCECNINFHVYLICGISVGTCDSVPSTARSCCFLKRERDILMHTLYSLGHFSYICTLIETVDEYAIGCVFFSFYCKTSMARTQVARLPWMVRTRF